MTKPAGVVEEMSWWMDVNGERAVCGTAGPDQYRELAAGRLLTDGWIQGHDEIEALDIGRDGGLVAVRARIPSGRATATRAERAHRRLRGCGLRHFVDCDSSLRRFRQDPIPFERFHELFRQLFAAPARASEVGGLHAAALFADGDLRPSFTDVGRHNAVDKAIGESVLAGVDRRSMGLLTTARISAEIALKAARADLAWVASRSIPTTLAVEIAGVAALPLIARAAGPAATVIAPPAGIDAS